MSVTVFAAVLFAAFLHAAWNAALKSGTGDKLQAMLRFTLCQSVVGALLLPVLPPLPLEVWPWLMASALIHVAYQMCLAYAYREGDLSRVYPISRGAAPVIVLGVTLLWGFEGIAPFEALGALILTFGILTMARGVFSNAESKRLLPFALGAACATAGYTLVDGMGARIMGNGAAYVAYVMLLSGLAYLPFAFVLHKGLTLRAPAHTWGFSLLAAMLSASAYAIAVWAMTQAPIALVAALRETSILFAVLIGWLILGDKMDRIKAAAASVIVLGVVLMRL